MCKKLVVIMLLQICWVIPIFAGELLTDNQKKAAFIMALSESIDHVQQTKENHRAQVTEAGEFLRSVRTTLQNLERLVNQPDFPPDGNRQAASLSRQMICRLDIAVPMGIEQLGYTKGWDDYQKWAKGVKETLTGDAVGNAYLWYGRYDFYAGIEMFQALNDTLYNKRAAFISETCGLIEQEFFTVIDELAARLDGFNQTRDQIRRRAEEIMQIADEEQRQAALEQLRAEAQEIKRQGDQTKAELNRITATLRESVQQRSIDMRRAIEQLLARISALEIPERGKIRGTDPSRIRFRNRRVFGVTFKGRGLPTGLSAQDFQFPAGLQHITHQGNSRRLYLRMSKSDALAEGRQAIMIAGEPVYFTFENQEETDTNISQPLLSRSSELPTGTGQTPADGKGTFLTPEALLDHPQIRRGYWRDTDGQDTSATPYHFEQFKKQGKDWFVLKGVNREPDIFEGLVPRQRMDLTELSAKGIVGQYDKVQGECFSGLRATKEVPRPDGTEVCPADRWWEPSTLCFDQNNLSAKERTDGRKHDEETCETTDTPSQIEGQYERYVGLSFKPIQPGKYIHTLTVTAPAAFQMTVVLEWDYSIIEPAKLEFYIRRINDNQLIKQEVNAPVKNSQYVFTTNSAGRYSFEIQVFGSNGRIIHQDTAAAYLER